MSTTQEWMDNVLNYITNPAAIQRQALSQLEARVDGDHVVVDPTSPFVFLMEMSATGTAAAAARAEALTRRIYPIMAMTDDEVYNHMSDVDFVGRFATPARGKFRIFLHLNEIYQRAVPTGTGNTRQLTIPRNTEIHVAQLVFTLQYPIDIRIMSHGGLQIVYNTDIASPLEVLASNEVEWSTAEVGDKTYVRLDIPAYQFEITTYTNKLNNAGRFEKTYAVTDDFYHARVYYSDLQGRWIEMHTTHSDQVFDPFTPTALLKLAGERLTVSIPTVYLTTQLVNTELKVDLYTSRGRLQQALTGYLPNSFVMTFLDRATGTLDQYSSPMTVFSDMGIQALSDVDGGNNQISFEALRARVINNAIGTPDLPITNAQLSTDLANRGYSVVLNVDQVTNRQFLATRLLPVPTDGSLISGSGSTMQTLIATTEELVAHTHCVSDNGSRVTILPNALYQYTNGQISIVPKSTIDLLMSLPVDARSRRVNEAQYLFSPFHYVLDTNDNRFDLRGYYMDNPSIDSKSFVQENDTTGLSVSVASYSIERIEGGYMLYLVCRSSDAWKELEDTDVFCQLSYIPTGEQDRAYQNGTLAAVTTEAERIYTFFLGTAFDLDNRNDLLLNTFQMYDNGARPHPTPLLHNFDVMFAVRNSVATPGFTPSEIDQELGHELLPDDVVGVTRERLEVRLGYALEGLWSSARSVVGSEDYARYTADVPWLYEEDVFERDPLTGAIKLNWNPTTQEYEYVYLHRAGDPILDQHGEPTIKYRVGDIMLDADGKPIVISSRKMQRQSDLMLLDGVYWFATDAAATAYRDSLPRTIVTWLEQDIAPISELLLEQTKLYFYTQSTIGSVQAIVGENRTVSLNAAQSFEVEFYVNDTVYRDNDLRDDLRRMAISSINDVLSNPVVTLDSIYKKIKDGAGDDSIGVKITGLGGATPQAAVSLLDDSARLSIKRIAVDKADGTIAVRDDVNVLFLKHRN